MLPLAFGAILAGALLVIAGVTGSTVSSTAQGTPDRSKATLPTGASSPTTTAPPTPAPSNLAGGTWRSTQAAIAKTRGWSLSDWNALIGKESGGDPSARNSSSGAFGIGQFLGSTAQEYAPYGALSTNPVLQIKAMAKYIADRYGNPTNALAHENAAGWY
jgi:hypothetical protein